MTFALPPLYAILDAQNEAKALSFAKELLEAKIQLLQLRAKNLSEEKLTSLAKQIIALRSEIAPTCKIIINDYPHIAKAVGADGVHLGQGDISPQNAREILGPSAIIGLSTHNEQQVKNAPIKTLDYLAIGPIFDSQTKSGHAPTVGLEALHRIVTLSPLPLVAIGGITLQNAASVFNAGASSVAVISELEQSKDLKETIKNLAQLRQ